MSANPPARIFISYSTKDGKQKAAEVRSLIEAEGLSVWQDLIALEGNADWWTQIEHTLRDEALQHFVLVVSPKALESPVVRQEIRLARQEGKTVSPVRGPAHRRPGRGTALVGQSPRVHHPAADRAHHLRPSNRGDGVIRRERRRMGVLRHHLATVPVLD